MCATLWPPVAADEMPAPCFLVNRLAPGELLRVLAELGPRVGELAASDLRIELGVEGAVLVIPDRGPGDATQAAPIRALLQVIDRLYTLDQRGHPSYEIETLPGLAEGACGALFASHAEASPAAAEPGEHLVVAAGIAPERLAALFERLHYDCTGLEVATARDGRGGELTLFHVRDDVERMSSFQALRASGLLDGLPVLDGYRSAAGLVFLPGDRAPSERSLELFGQIVAAAPQLFASELEHPPTHDLIVAIVAIADARAPERIEVLLLRQLELRRKTRLAPAGRLQVSMCTLEGSREAEVVLASAVRRARPSVGYQLELRRGSLAAASEVEIERLQEQVNALEERKAYLRGLLQPRPRLFRFRQTQLPALADVIRRFPVSLLGGEGLLYGFQADVKRAPEGVHYLLFEPDAAMMEQPFPDWMWRGRDQPAMAFWLDPFWSAHYLREPTRSEVFVPRGMALYPPLHSWGETGMDGYLRDAVRDWSRGRVGETPERATYVFDGPYDPDDSLRIDVLDRAGFVPLRHRLGWLNRNLEVQERLDVDQLVTRMSDASSRTQLAESFTRAASIAERRLERAGRRLGEVVLSEVDSLSSILTREVEAAAARAQSDLARIEEIHVRLDGLATALRDAGELDAGQQTAMERLRRLATSFRNQRTQLDRAVRNLVIEADETVADVEGKLADLDRVDAKLDRLQRRAREGR